VRIRFENIRRTRAHAHTHTYIALYQIKMTFATPRGKYTLATERRLLTAWDDGARGSRPNYFLAIYSLPPDVSPNFSSLVLAGSQ